jgi:hypothetical protein
MAKKAGAATARTPRRPDPLPNSYQTRSRPTTGMTRADSTIEMRWGPSRFISVPKAISTSRRDHASKLRAEKDAVLEWLSYENPPAVQVLRRVGQCSSPFAGLLLRTCEEMEHHMGPKRSEKLDDLDREAALKNATLKVEIEQQQERLVRSQREKTHLGEQLAGFQRKLDQVNIDIDRLQRLAVVHKVDEFIEHQKKAEPVVPKFEARPVIPLDDKIYQELWVQQQELTESNQVLLADLRGKQQTQMKEMKAFIKRRYPQFSTVR